MARRVSELPGTPSPGGVQWAIASTMFHVKQRKRK